MVPWRCGISKLMLNLVWFNTQREIPYLCTPMYYSLYVFDLSECVPWPIYIIDQYCFVEGYKFELKGWDWENKIILSLLFKLKLK